MPEATNRPLLGHADTMVLLDAQVSLTQKMWFALTGIVWVAIVVYVGFAAYYSLSHGIPCSAGPLADVLIAKLVLFFLVIALQLSVYFVFKRNAVVSVMDVGQLHFQTQSLASEKRKLCKSLLQLQQLVFFANCLLSLYVFYISFQAAGVSFPLGILNMLSDDVECGWYAVDASSYFLIFWILTPIVMLVSLPRDVSKLDYILTTCHFYPM
eukprot:TRINITY_DN5571_c0_g1_i1.p1 TRINITY_DN5571_c0_g1~~TRINITY_DN5571_c0_g1_i1.p1  ORF type:complete len:240 (+),score=29.12 TRINITY_DN5571_c0_g1_i1:88-720(+)